MLLFRVQELGGRIAYEEPLEKEEREKEECCHVSMQILMPVSYTH